MLTRVAFRRALAATTLAAVFSGAAAVEAAVVNAFQVEDAISARRGNSFFGTGYSAAGEVEVASQRSSNGTADPQNNRASRTFVEFQLTQELIDEAAAAAGTSVRAELGFSLQQVVNGPGNLEGLDIRYFGINAADRDANTLWNTPTQETAQNVIYPSTPPGPQTAKFSNALVVGDIAGAAAGQYVAFGIVTDRGVDNSVTVGGLPDRQVYLLGDATSSYTLGLAAPTTLVTPLAIQQTAGDTLGGYHFGNLINNSGFSGAIPNAADYTTFAHPESETFGQARWATATGVYPNNYFDTGQTPPQFVLSLGQKYDLTDLVVWGYGGNANEASNFTVEFSDDGGASYSSGVDVGTSFRLDTGVATLPLGGTFTADTVRVTMTDNAGGVGFGGTGPGDRVGLGEIKFLGDPRPTAPQVLVTPKRAFQTAGDTLGGYPVDNLVNNSGFDGAAPDASNYRSFAHPASDSGGESRWVTAAAVYPNNYFDQGQTPPQFVLPLGRTFDVTDLVVWGYAGNANEASNFTVEFSDDGGASYYASADVGATFLMATGSATLALGDAYRADTVRVTMTDNAGGLGFGGVGPGDRVGLGEVKVLVNAPPPAILVTPVGITQTASDTLGGYPIENLINNSGFDGAVPTADDYMGFAHPGSDSAGNALWATASAVYPNNYFDQGLTPPQFVLDLGRRYDLTDLIVWGYAGNANEASDFTVEFSDDGGATYYASADVAASYLLATDNLTLSFDGTFPADTVRLTMTDNAGGRGFGGAGPGDRVGLGEIKFLARIPEPSSLVLCALGLAGLGAYCGLRRKGKTAG